jgi:hypothetical protein
MESAFAIDDAKVCVTEADEVAVLFLFKDGDRLARERLADKHRLAKPFVMTRQTCAPMMRALWWHKRPTDRSRQPNPLTHRCSLIK